MPSVVAPWSTITSTAAVNAANARSDGFIQAHAGTAIAAWDVNFAWLERGIEAPAGAVAGNVRLEHAVSVSSYAGAGGFLAGFTAWTSIALTAREEGAQSRSARPSAP